MNGSSSPRPEPTAGLRPPYAFTGDPTASLIATAIHAGHEVRPEVLSVLKLPESDRLREEDPFTDRIAACADAHVVVSRSRFEVDLNRGRDSAVYRTPDDCWGLDLWKGGLPDDMISRSIDIYDDFYRDLAGHLDRLATGGPFVVFDVHSYNYRREGVAGTEDPAAETPDINVGTKAMRGRWRSVVESFLEEMNGFEVVGKPLDVRENIRFKGANLSHWVTEHYPNTGIVLALEFKKTFMDEWTGRVDERHLDELTGGLRASIPAVLAAVRTSSA